MGIIAVPQHPPIVSPRLTVLRRVARTVGLRLLAWATRSARADDRESIRQRHELEAARAERERQWQSAVHRLPLR